VLGNESVPCVISSISLFRLIFTDRLLLIEPQENGVRAAIAQIYTYLPRAGRDRRSLPK
jgi:hypothetical protein